MNFENDRCDDCRCLFISTKVDYCSNCTLKVCYKCRSDCLTCPKVFCRGCISDFDGFLSSYIVMNLEKQIVPVNKCYVCMKKKS